MVLRKKKQTLHSPEDKHDESLSSSDPITQFTSKRTKKPRSKSQLVVEDSDASESSDPFTMSTTTARKATSRTRRVKPNSNNTIATSTTNNTVISEEEEPPSSSIQMTRGQKPPKKILDKGKGKAVTSDNNSNNNTKKIDKGKGKQVLRDEDEESEDPLSFPVSYVQRNEQRNPRQFKRFTNDEDTSDDPLTQFFVTTTAKSRKLSVNKKRPRPLRRQKIQRFPESSESEDDEFLMDFGSRFVERNLKSSKYSLEPTVCFISQTTIQQRWKPLDTSSKRQLVRALKNIASSVTFNIRNASKRAEVQRDLDALISRLLAEERDALERLQEMKISQGSRSSRGSESKLYALLQAEIEDPIDIDDELIKKNIPRAIAPLTTEEGRSWDPDKDQTIIDLKNSLLPHFRSINNGTQSLDDIVCGIGDAEKKLWRILRVAGLDEQIAQRLVNN
ncbi:9889_t:CDS:2 [Ambispora gerdemannii]|uniref:9889_t:CDS:1 n=1 Tax=Ambispora gerdemannii TaxID=144530 RepID=A0A9N8ZGF0_9GLOM|nr:9889_t:CDS:2 [Ambispora gerdemannii]